MPPKTMERKTLTDRAAVELAGSEQENTGIPLSAIRTDGGTQMRAGLHDTTVEEYAEALRTGGSLPAITVYHDGETYWLADGFHRVAAHKRAHGRNSHIRAIVKSGTRRDAILHAAGANSDHGLRRSNEDKRRAVETLLNDPEWSAWSDREIARQCKVDHKTVGAARRELTGEIPSERTYTTRHGTEATMQTGRIQDSNAQRPAPERTRPVYTETEPTAAKSPPEGYALKRWPGRGWRWEREVSDCTTALGTIFPTAAEAIEDAETDLARRTAHKTDSDANKVATEPTEPDPVASSYTGARVVYTESQPAPEPMPEDDEALSHAEQLAGDVIDYLTLHNVTLLENGMGEWYWQQNGAETADLNRFDSPVEAARHAIETLTQQAESAPAASDDMRYMVILDKETFEALHAAVLTGALGRSMRPTQIEVVKRALEEARL